MARRSRTAENIAAIAESVEENPGLSIPRHSFDLGIPQTSLYHILHKDLGLKAYKVQLTQELTPADHPQRRVFTDWVVEMHENDQEIHRKKTQELLLQSPFMVRRSHWTLLFRK